MALTRTNIIRLLKFGGIAVFAMCIIAYAIWRSLNYARGPVIHVVEPLSGASVSSQTVSVRGQALRVSNLSLNGMPVSVDEQGNFDEQIIVFPGINKLTLSANDQFGRSTQTELDVLGTTDLPVNNSGTSTSP
jgi:hypothetical protein